MKGKILELVKNSKKFRIGAMTVALATVIGTIGVFQAVQVPDLPVYTADPITEVTIVEEETPLAAKTTTKTSKKTSTKTKKLSKKSKKSYTKNLGTTTKKSTKTSKSSSATIKKQTTVKTNVKEYYYKNKKYKKVKTTKTTTVKTTTTPVAKKGKYEVAIDKIAPKMDASVRNAFTTLGFKVYVDSSVNYSGYFDAKSRTITLKKEDETVYHELGHFLAFISGNTDTSSSFKAVYNAEKNKYTGSNKSYVIQSSSEYFAESVKDYTLNASALKNTRPQTYSAVQEAMKKVTTAQINKLKLVYGSVWK